MSRLSPQFSRRCALRSIVGGSLLMPGIVSELLANDNPLAAKPPHFPAKAKRVIFLYMTGGVSHVDSFDPKPKLTADHGKHYSAGEKAEDISVTENAEMRRRRLLPKFLVKSQFRSRRRGQSGIEVTDLFPHVAQCVDDLCVIRSMKNDFNDHFEATLGIHTGSVTFTRPSIGSWVSYGLGTINQNLPSFVALAPYLPYAGGHVWGADFLPAVHQGIRIERPDDPIPNLRPQPASVSLQPMELELLAEMNSRHFESRSSDPSLAARTRSFETAFGMQQEAPEIFDLSDETDETLSLYGLQRGQTDGFAWQCLVARRLAERGVRFVELVDSPADINKNWDAHFDILSHIPRAQNVDRGIAALLKDLKRRGMLDDTLVVWTTEFGRTPFHTERDGKGREHHAPVFSSWLAGGGVKAGITHGESDEYGVDVAEDLVHVHDFHATILHLLGIDHTRLTYRHSGRDYRLTDVAGRVVREILA